MSRVIEQIRSVCSLGAIQSVLAIDRAVPIIHGGPGCGQKLWLALSNYHGYQGSSYAGGHSVPCTNTGETEVVFGGEEKLREVTAGTLKVMDADLFVILTGCTADIVGDDVGEVARSFQSQGKPVVYAETGGFKGNNLRGHEMFLEALFKQFLEPSDQREEGLVNLWSVIPYHDAFWTGNLHALRDLLASIGLKANLVFGPKEGIESIKKIPKAQFNLLVSPWVGLKNVQQLEQAFGTPYLHYPVLPIGPSETSRFLRAVGDFAGIDRQKVEQAIGDHEDRYYYYIERAADFILESRSGLPSRFVTVADSFYSLGIARFLINDLGLLPETQFITDGTPEEYQGAIADEFKRFHEGIQAEVVFTGDGGVVRDALRKIKFRERPLILGSSWDRAIARELKGYPLSVSMPVSDRMVLSRSYVGYDGGLRLAEDIYSVIISDYQ